MIKLIEKVNKLCVRRKIKDKGKRKGDRGKFHVEISDNIGSFPNLRHLCTHMICNLNKKKCGTFLIFSAIFVFGLYGVKNWQSWSLN